MKPLSAWQIIGECQCNYVHIYYFIDKPSLDEEVTDSVELELSELFPEVVDAQARFAGLWVAW